MLKKIFVTRGNVKIRRELNLAQIKAALEPHGFVFMSMEGKTMQEEADIFGNADVVMAVHGSALHNTLFSRPGTKVIEIFPYEYFDNSNYIIASYSSCDYHYLIGEPLPTENKPVTYEDRNAVDIRVNPKKLLQLCTQIGVIPEKALTS